MIGSRSSSERPLLVRTGDRVILARHRSGTESGGAASLAASNWRVSRPNRSLIF